jgi:addiction module RelE/StbE family toxin
MAAVRWTQRARDDLRDIHDFIARDSPRAAEALVERLLTATERLAVFPESGRVVPEFPALGYREIIVSSYRVLYRLADNTVWITAVVHGRRLLRSEPDNAYKVLPVPPPRHGYDVLAAPDGSGAGAGGGTIWAYGYTGKVLVLRK